MNGSNFTNKAQDAIMQAQQLAQEKGQQQIDALHLLFSLLSQEGSIIITILQKLGVDVDNLKKKAEAQIIKIPVISTPTAFGQFYLTQDMAKVLDRARQEAMNMQDEFISVEHLFLALLDVRSNAKEVLEKISFFFGEQEDGKFKTSKLDYESVLKVLSQIRGGQRITDPEPESKYQVIEKYTRNLTSLASAGKIDPIIGRENEIRRLMQIISRRTKNNPVLIGEAGVGKTAIVEGFARRISEGNVPDVFLNKKICSLNLTSLVAGSAFRGELEMRFKQLLEDVRQDENVILFIDEIHNLVGAGSSSGTLDAANILKPALARGELRCIGATTPQESKKHIEEDPALERRFQPILVEQPTPQEACDIIHGLLPSYEQFHRVSVAPEAVDAAVRLSDRYITDKTLPDKAIDLIDEAASGLRIALENKPPLLEETDRKIRRLEIERQALQKDLEGEHAKEIKERIKIIALRREALQRAVEGTVPQEDLLLILNELAAAAGGWDRLRVRAWWRQRQRALEAGGQPR